MERIDVEELRQNFSKYLTKVERGATFVVTEGEAEVAWLSPPGTHGSSDASAATFDAESVERRSSIEVLEEMREERL